MTLNQTVNSKMIKTFFTKNGWEMPTINTMKKIILHTKDLHVERVKNMINTELHHNTKFSASIDEWTSISNKRYLNIILNGISMRGQQSENLFYLTLASMKFTVQLLLII